MKVFQQELVKGHKRIGIFYGAAHMPDFERRLTEEFGMRLQSEKWLTAWDLRMIPNSPVESLIGQIVEQMLELNLQDR